MRWGKLCGAACVAALTISACGGGGGDSLDFESGATYTEALPADPGNLHPLRAVQQETYNVQPFAYDSLINLDAKGRVVSQLAESWTATPTKATYTLRPDVTCADGTKLTAEMVADTFRWVKDPANKSTVIGDKFPSADFDVEANDAKRTVTITLAQPYGLLLKSAGLVPIVCPKGLADPKRVAHATDGTGPFELTDYAADDHLTLTVRKDYRWGPDGASTSARGFPSKVVLKIVQDETTAANLLVSGQITSAGIAGPDRERLAGQGFNQITEFNGPSDLFFNQRPGHPGADPDVRKALVTGLDRTELMKVATGDAGEIPKGLVILPPRTCRYDSVSGSFPERDPEAAKALLEDAGWKAAGGGTRSKDGRPLSITIGYPTAGPTVNAAMELLAQWWEELGADVKLKGQGSNAALQTLFAGNAWDATYLQVGLTFPNMFMPFASGPPSPEGQNFAALDNPEYERLANEALQTTGQAGCDLWEQAEQALFRAVDVMPAAADRVDTFSRDARLAIGVNGTEPTTIRMLAR